MSGDISDLLNWGDPPSIRQVGTGGLLYTHSTLDGWDVSSTLGMGEASSCLGPES